MSNAFPPLTAADHPPTVAAEHRPRRSTPPAPSPDERGSAEADGAVRARALGRFRTAAIGYAAVFGMALILVAVGFLPQREVFILTGWCGLGLLAFYALISSGRTRHFTDPACAFAQVLLGISTLLLGCVLVPQDRVAAVQLFFLIVAYDLTRLSRRQVGMTAAATIAGLLSISLGIWWMTGDDRGLRHELVSLTLMVVYVLLLVIVGKGVRERISLESSQRAALSEALEQLQILSERDALTGAPNRRHGEALLAREGVRHGRHGTPVSLGLLDIDFFKRVNDSHGHATGDAVLVALVRLAGTVLAPEVTIARWGGEEFLVVMPETRSAGAVAAMQRLRDTISAADWTACAPGLHLDVSVGVCELVAGNSIEQTLEQADAALYRAKNEGRGRVVEHRR